MVFVMDGYQYVHNTHNPEKHRKYEQKPQQCQIAKLLKPEYSVLEHVEAEGLFLDLSENKLVILGITNEHLIVASADGSLELESMTPLPFITITIVEFGQKRIQVVYCTKKDSLFQLCEPVDQLEGVWRDFVGVIKDRNLDAGFKSEFHCNLSKGDSDPDSASILGTYIGFVSNHYSHGDQIEPDHPDHQLSWWQDGFTYPKHRKIEKELRQILKESNAGREKSLNIPSKKLDKQMSMTALFDRVHVRHFAMGGSLDNIETKCAKTSRSWQSYNSGSDWSTSSNDEESYTPQPALIDVVQPAESKFKSWRNKIRTKYLKSKSKPKLNKKPIILLSCCIAEVEYDSD